MAIHLRLYSSWLQSPQKTTFSDHDSLRRRSSDHRKSSRSHSEKSDCVDGNGEEPSLADLQILCFVMHLFAVCHPWLRFCWGWSDKTHECGASRAVGEWADEWWPLALCGLGRFQQPQLRDPFWEGNQVSGSPATANPNPEIWGMSFVPCADLPVKSSFC